MPYIKLEGRLALDEPIDRIWELLDNPESDQLDGQLNYVISRIVGSAFAPSEGEWSYHSIARCIAVFECAKLEFYRRVAGPKEDKAIKTNGDIDEYRSPD